MSSFKGDYVRYYDMLHQAKPYDEETKFILTRYEKLKGRRPKNVLDMASGTGRHAECFMKAGLKVHANDLSQSMTAATSKRLQAVTSGGPTSYFVSNGPMQEVRPNLEFAPGGYDLVTVTYTALGYLVEPPDLQKFFANLSQLLSKDGICFFDVWNGPVMATKFSPHRERKFTTEQCEIHRVSNVSASPEKNALRVNFDFNILDKATGRTEKFSETHLVRYFSVPELQNICLANGLKLVESGPYFDESNSLSECWNFYALVEKSR